MNSVNMQHKEHINPKIVPQMNVNYYEMYLEYYYLDYKIFTSNKDRKRVHAYTGLLKAHFNCRKRKV